MERSVDDELEDLEKMPNAVSQGRDRNSFIVAVDGAFDLDRDDGWVEAVADDAEIPQKVAVGEAGRNGRDDAGVWEVAAFEPGLEVSASRCGLR